MKLDLPYGDQSQSIFVPAGVNIHYVVAAQATGIGDIDETLRDVCSEPIESRPLSACVATGDVLVVVSDVTRSPATRDILGALIPLLEHFGVGQDRIRILVARGTHRALTREERMVLRETVPPGIKVAEHDCDNGESVGALLLTHRGTAVRVNKLLRDAQTVILLSAVSFHYFAGFGGGRKLVLPGCADRKSIEANHRLSLTDTKRVGLHPSCRAGNVEGNPVHEDMCEAAEAVRGTFAINFYTDTDGQVLFLNAGDLLTSHADACEAFAAHAGVPVEEAVHLVVASAGGVPYDINLLQAHKGLRHATRLLSDGGALLYYAQCGEGVGSVSLSNAVLSDTDTFFATAYNNYTLNNQTAISLLGLTHRYRVGMVTELDDATLRAAGIERITNPEAFLAEALESRGTSKIAVMAHASHTLPTLKGSKS